MSAYYKYFTSLNPFEFFIPLLSHLMEVILRIILSPSNVGFYLFILFIVTFLLYFFQQHLKKKQQQLLFFYFVFKVLFFYFFVFRKYCF